MNRLDDSNRTLWSLLQNVSPFDTLEDNLRSELMDAATPLDCEAGQTVLHQDEPSPGMFLIESGVVKVSRLNHNGREYILTVLDQGSTFNDVTIWDQGANPASVIAQTDCRIWCFPCQVILDIAIRHPALALIMAANMARQARYLVGELDGLSMCSVKARLARFLLNQSGANNYLRVLLTQEEMASHLGTVREMVSRSLHRFKRDGIIQMQPEVITILDRSLLIAEAEL